MFEIRKRREDQRFLIKKSKIMILRKRVFDHHILKIKISGIEDNKGGKPRLEKINTTKQLMFKILINNKQLE